MMIILYAYKIKHAISSLYWLSEPVLQILISNITAQFFIVHYSKTNQFLRTPIKDKDISI